MKVAENLNKVNMDLVVIFLFLNAVVWARSKQEFIPVWLWTSSDFQIGKNAGYSALDKIKSDLFQFYVSELLGDKNPTIVVFLEQVLGTDDFESNEKYENNSFPFLTKLIAASKADYFREVEDPHEILTQLSQKGYQKKHLKLDQEFVISEGDLLLMEFSKIDEHRPDILKTHDQAMEKISEELTNLGKSWVCVYTARRSNTTESFPHAKLSSWYVEEQIVERPVRALSMYEDEHTGFALITRGSIELHLPSFKSMTFKPLDNYLRASATSFKKKINFALWFLNYKLTFYLNQENQEWIIQEAKIMNDNGDTLNLMQQHEETIRKCRSHMSEFVSAEDPKIKVKLPKYKFLKLPKQESCAKPYGVGMTAIFILSLIVLAILVWTSILENYDFSAESKLSSHKILTFRLKQ